ncbi:hypothetical protein [Halorubrum sp. ASP1]|uniref:hypothetical protein n=1 Tax=Halorubrum sp. ASP1 TaxID=2518114 RepID=UPI0018EEAD95|nr:hypothetical protein [Halorubrum sp. ASP1]
MRDRERKTVDVAYVDEGVRVTLEVRVNPVPLTEPFCRGQVVREPERDIEVGRFVASPRNYRVSDSRGAPTRSSTHGSTVHSTTRERSVAQLRSTAAVVSASGSG